MTPYNGGYRAVNRAPYASAQLPASFFINTGDKAACKSYIDSLVLRRVADSLRFEHQGIVTEVVPGKYQTGKVNRIRASTFFEFMALTSEAEVPLFDKVSFVTDGERLVPTDFIAALAKYVPVDVNAPWRLVRSEKDLPPGVTAEQVHSGMYRNAPAGAVDSGDEDQPEEVELGRKVSGKSVELLTRIDSDPPYYVRRIFSNRGKTIYAATSWGPTGPWNVTERDNSILLALGITP